MESEMQPLREYYSVNRKKKVKTKCRKKLNNTGQVTDITFVKHARQSRPTDASQVPEPQRAVTHTRGGSTTDWRHSTDKTFPLWQELRLPRLQGERRLVPSVSWEGQLEITLPHVSKSSARARQSSGGCGAAPARTRLCSSSGTAVAPAGCCPSGRRSTRCVPCARSWLARLSWCGQCASASAVEAVG